MEKYFFVLVFFVGLAFSRFVEINNNLIEKLNDDEFLPNWMGQIFPAIQNSTIHDLSLPGTHDALTFDLSTRISDGGLDDYPELCEVLNIFPNFFIGDWIRDQAQTHVLNMTGQLNNGIRFIDFRIMYTTGDWYGLHCVQTNHKALTYLTQIREWLDNHPTEIVILWLSKHGSTDNTGNDQYPNVTISTKQAFWGQIQNLFSGLLFDTTISQTNTTTIAELIQRNQRVVIYASDYVEFSNSSKFAIDARKISNEMTGPITGVEKQIETFKNASMHLEDLKSQGRFYLLSMAGGPSTKAIELSAFIRYLDLNVTENRRDCAAEFQVPGFNDWCPETLLDVGQLSNYYNQFAFEASRKNNYAFPNAIYINAVSDDGSLRTGIRRLSMSSTDIVCPIFIWTPCSSSQPSCPDGYTGNGNTLHFNSSDSFGNELGFCVLPNENHYRCCRNTVNGDDNAQYSYSTLLILSTVKRNCQSSACSSLISLLEQKVSMYPAKYWDDINTARMLNYTNPAN